MALQKTFRALADRLRQARDHLRDLRITVVEDRPLRNDCAIVDRIEETVDDLTGWLEEALDGATEAERSVSQTVDLERALRALSACQERFHRVQLVFGAGLASYDCMNDLIRFGNQRRGEWLAWVKSVKQGVDPLRKELEQASQAIGECWQELTEQAAQGRVSVHAVGQAITISGGERDER